MSNTRRWREFRSWWSTIDVSKYENADQLAWVIDKKITDLKLLKPISHVDGKPTVGTVK